MHDHVRFLTSVAQDGTRDLPMNTIYSSKLFFTFTPQPTNRSSPHSQKFQHIKRLIKAANDNSGSASPNKANTPKSAKTTKPKTPTTAAKGRKRKATDNEDGDDDEGTLFAPKSQKMKKDTGDQEDESSGGEVFKLEEDVGDAVDLEHDE